MRIPLELELTEVEDLKLIIANFINWREGKEIRIYPYLVTSAKKMLECLEDATNEKRRIKAKRREV